VTLWDGGEELHPLIRRFTVGRDHELDLRLVAHDCRASAGHARMLEAMGVLSAAELERILEGLAGIEEMHARGEFEIRPEDEDCHTAIEKHLTLGLGETGQKIHTARSRNDQVLTALRLYEKEELERIRGLLVKYADALEELAGRHEGAPLPGYTHMQPAMPTTVDTWLGSFVAAAVDDQRQLDAALVLVDQSPLGTAAGFGVPLLHVCRPMTARDLGFARVMENPMYAQLSRGKFEAVVLGVCSQIMLDLNRLATDLALFAMQEMGLVRLPPGLTTGSSIMPRKRNPDTLELVRASYHVVVGEEMKVKSIVSNLMSGYNRDVQLTKEPLFAGIDTTKSCLSALTLVLREIEIDEERCRACLTDDMYATERAYALVLKGVPFREAYRIVARSGPCTTPSSSPSRSR
jgi:argininosuccinate lyase